MTFATIHNILYPLLCFVFTGMALEILRKTQLFEFSAEATKNI